MSRPKTDEYGDYWSRYIDLAPEDDVTPALDKQGREIDALLTKAGEEKGGFRYAPGKWSVKEVTQHIADTERIMMYRALSIARGETKSLPGFDENVFASNADADRRTLADIRGELASVRAATVALLRGFSDAAWNRIGTANENKISVRALAYIVLGHTRHHEKILRERYLKT